MVILFYCYTTAGADYTRVVSQTVTFAAGEATASASIPITDDNILESDETFIVSLIPNPNVIIVRNGSVTIQDDDGECIVKHIHSVDTV